MKLTAGEEGNGLKMEDKVLMMAWVFTSSLEILNNQVTGVLALTDTLCCALGHLSARHFEVDSGLFHKKNGRMRWTNTHNGSRVQK